MATPEPLPPGTRLVHVGPHKTGTTAVQFAFHEAREALAAQGVVYAGTTSQVYLPALGLTGRRGRIGGPRGSEEDWLGLVEECRAAGDRRVVLSSESFANAGPSHIERLADDLGRERVHAVRMVRRYDKMIPSQWQQQVSAGGRRSYDDYLEGLLANPDHGFWRRHGFVPLTRTWADCLGADRVTVVVVDETDRGWLLRVMEQLVGLRPGTLRPSTERENRSLTMGEVETLRALNGIRKDQGWGDRSHFEYVRRGVSVALRTMPPDPQGGKIVLPPALAEAVHETTERDLAALAELGVRVVGDPDWLRPMPAGDSSPPGGEDSGHPTPADVSSPAPTVSVESAAVAVTAVVGRARETGGFPLGGETETDGGRRRSRLFKRATSRPSRTDLDEAGQALVDALGGDWSDTERRRYLDEGVLPALTSDSGKPDPHKPGPARLDPTRVAAVLAAVIAGTDPTR